MNHAVRCNSNCKGNREEGREALFNYRKTKDTKRKEMGSAAMCLTTATLNMWQIICKTVIIICITEGTHTYK